VGSCLVAIALYDAKTRCDAAGRPLEVMPIAELLAERIWEIEPAL
jgi:hypothetical protein